MKIKIPDLQNTRRSLLKREEGTYHHNEKLIKEMPGFLSPGKDLPLLIFLNIQSQRIPDKIVNFIGHFLTLDTVIVPRQVEMLRHPIFKVTVY